MYFQKDVLNLFDQLGIDYCKEVDMLSYQIQEDGLHYIGGIFHFKGRLIKGKNCYIPLGECNAYTIDLTKVSDNFEIGFSTNNNPSFFLNREELVQIDFATNIPWVIDKSLEIK